MRLLADVGPCNGDLPRHVVDLDVGDLLHPAQADLGSTAWSRRRAVLRVAAGAAPERTGSPEDECATVAGRPVVTVQVDADMHRLSMEIAGSLDMERVLLTVANASARLVTSEVAGVLLTHTADDGSRELRMRCAIGHRAMETARLRVPAGRGLAGKVLETGRPERIDDYVTATGITTDFLGTAIQEGAQSGSCVPMRDGAGEIMGVLAVWRLRPSAYSDEDEALLVSLAGLAAIGLVNAQLYQQQQRTSDELEVYRRGLERRLQVSDEALEIHHRLTQIAAEGNDLTALARAVHGFIGGPIVIVPAGDRPPVLWPPGAAADLPRERDARPVREAVGSASAQPAAAGMWVSVSIEAANVRHGQLYACLPSNPRPRDVVTLEQSATICALLLGHEDALQAATARLRSEFLWELLEGRSSESDAVGRALALGLQLAFPVRIVLLRARGLRQVGCAEGWSAEEAERGRTWLAARIGAGLGEQTGTVVHVAHRDEHVVAILPVHGAAAVRPAELAAAALRRSPFPSLVIEAGISRAAPTPEALPQALHEARVALSAITPMTGPVVLFDDLGVLQFLIAPSGAADLYRYAEGILGPLVEYDRRHGSDLVTTLDRYFEHGCNASKTARDLQLHAKSLAYRLRRIAEIADLDLEDRRTRLDVELALRILGPASEINACEGLGGVLAERPAVEPGPLEAAPGRTPTQRSCAPAPSSKSAASSAQGLKGQPSA